MKTKVDLSVFFAIIFAGVVGYNLQPGTQPDFASKFCELSISCGSPLPFADCVDNTNRWLQEKLMTKAMRAEGLAGLADAKCEMFWYQQQKREVQNVRQIRGGDN